MEDKNILNEDINEVLTDSEATVADAVSVDTNAADTEAPLDKNVKLMSPMQMVMRRFFRSKLSIVGLVMIGSLFLFSFVGPLV